MPDVLGNSSGSNRPASEAFRQLPDGVALEDTAESAPSNAPFDPAEERNAFIGAAVQAGG
jgi:hypothetical protein